MALSHQGGYPGHDRGRHRRPAKCHRRGPRPGEGRHHPRAWCC